MWWTGGVNFRGEMSQRSVVPGKCTWNIRFIGWVVLFLFGFGVCLETIRLVII